MDHGKRSFLALSMGMVVASAFCFSATAQEYPSKPINLIVPYAPGGATDALARVVGDAAGRELGQQMLVVNKPGASGMIGANFAAEAPADGYTVLMAASSFVIQEVLHPKATNATLKDFQPIALMASIPMALTVHPSVPHASLADFVEYAKQRPGELNYANFGVGSTPHLVTEMMSAEVGVNMTPVAYKGAAPATLDLLRGEVQVFCDVLSTSLPMHQDGRTRMIAIMSEERSQHAPEIPTFAELGFPNALATVQFGILAPAGVPDSVVNRLHAAFSTALEKPEVAERIQAMYGVPGAEESPSQYEKLLATEREKWKEVIDRLGLKLE